MASFVQIAAVSVLAVWCLQILAPFLSIIVWAMIIAVALYPAHLALTDKLGGREKTSATIFVLIGLAILLVPAVLFTESSVNALRTVAEQLNAGEVDISPPDPSVAEWPVIGERVHEIWTSAAVNVEATLNQFSEQLQDLGGRVVRFAGGMAVGILQFVVSFIIAGVFLVSAKAGYRASRRFSTALVGNRGEALTDMAIATIRSVAKGVLGVALIQAFLSAIGLTIAGVPAPGLWSLGVLILAIMQLPPILLLGPIAIWVFSVAPPATAWFFAIYAILVSASDGVLKPLLLGRGVEVPMLVILLGAIGGMIMSGIVGLFIGAIVLALGYEILVAWMDTDEFNNPRPPAEEAEAD